MPTPVIQTKGLSKTFGAQRGIRDVEIQVKSGEIFSFLGPNGAGKSTTIRILMGLYHSSSGSASVLGLNPKADSVEIHRRTGYLPGELVLNPRLTGRQIFERFGSARGLRDVKYRDELIERFGAELDRPSGLLSKGNRQKLGLVLAFMHKPELLVLDEATTGLDPLLQREFVNLLEETVADGRTVFLSSHDLDEVQRVAHRVAIIKEGEIVVIDTVDGLRRHAPRTIDLAFNQDVNPSVFEELEGVEVSIDNPRRIVLTIIGPIAPVLRVVSLLDPIEILARPADLEELFLSYYRSKDLQGRANEF